MATASPKEVHVDRYSDCLPERYAEAFEEKRAMSLHQIGRVWPHSPAAPRKSLPYFRYGFECLSLLESLFVHVWRRRSSFDNPKVSRFRPKPLAECVQLQKQSK